MPQGASALCHHTHNSMGLPWVLLRTPANRQCHRCCLPSCQCQWISVSKPSKRIDGRAAAGGQTEGGSISERSASSTKHEGTVFLQHQRVDNFQRKTGLLPIASLSPFQLIFSLSCAILPEDIFFFFF